MANFEPERQAYDVSGPEMGQIRVLAITTAASAQQDLTEFLGMFVNMVSDVAFYLTCGSGTVTDPDETATTGNGRTFLIPANTIFPMRPTTATVHFKVKGTASGYLRWVVSSN